MAVSLVGLLRAAAATGPQRRAVSEPHGVSLTYAELDRASAVLASRLRSRRGDRVGLLAPKGVDAVVGLWAAMRTGAAYVPVDPTAPPARAAYIAQNCGMTSVLASDSLPDSIEAVRAAVPGIQVVPIDGVSSMASVGKVDAGAYVSSPAHAKDLAYVLYTSGSTGVPKGVMVSHGAALGFVDWAADTLALTPSDVLSSHAPFHFDLSTFDLFASVAAGASLVVLDEETVRFPMMSGDALERERISVWYSVPGALRRLVRGGRLASRDTSALRAVLFAGEVYPGDELRKLQAALPSHTRLLNLYGPTETNVCTFWEVPDAGTWHHDTPPIGVDCTSCQGAIVDEQLRPVPRGQPGELLVRGATLMTGYWGDPERTERSFVDDFMYPHLGDRFYRTGDLVSRDAEGLYRFHGRRDHMVKVRGYRVELGEVEAAIHRIEGMQEAAVVATERCHDGTGPETELVAFIAPAGAPRDITSIRRALSATLPKYMVPADLRWIDALPLTSSGKVDRQALHRLAGARPDQHEETSR